MKNKIAKLIATFFGSGCSPKAPGTAGSLASIPLAFALTYYGGLEAVLLASIIVFIIGTWATNNVMKASKVMDPGWIVIDETAGILVTFIPLANVLYQNPSLWWFYPLGFVFFRIFDIAKFGPVKWADSKIHNAFGVMLDDVFAGIFASICLYATYLYSNYNGIPRPF